MTMKDAKGEHDVAGTAIIKDRRMLLDAKVTSKKGSRRKKNGKVRYKRLTFFEQGRQR